jgi:hypothetical protein
MSETLKWQKDLLKGEIKEPRMREVGAHFIDIVKGPRAFAQMLKDDYDASDEGSLNRSRIMQLIVQTLKGNDGEGKGDLTLLSEEDLQRELKELLGGEKEAGTDGAVRGAGPDASHT